MFTELVLLYIYKKYKLKFLNLRARHRTVSGRDATFVFLSNGLAPVVMSIGNSMENYTLTGKHLFDSSMDLVEVEPIDYNLQPTGAWKNETVTPENEL